MSDTKLAEKPKSAPQLKDILNSPAIRDQIAKALPQHMRADRMIRVATTALLRTPDLAKCDQTSFMRCMLELSSYGLEPDGRRAHLIPRKNNQAGTTECTLIIDWKGLAELALRSGILSTVHADVVRENDDFEYDLGEIKRHKINYKQDRGEVYAAYAMARTKDGAQFSTVLSKDEILAIRDRSQGYQAAVKYKKTNPWLTDEFEMWKKTAFRRLSKWLPLSAEFRDAVDGDDDDYREEKPVAGREIPAANIPKLFEQPRAAAPTAEATPSAPPDLELSGDPPQGETPVQELRRRVAEAQLDPAKVDAFLADAMFPPLGEITDDEAADVLKQFAVLAQHTGGAK